MKKYKSGKLNEKEYDAVKRLFDVGMGATEISTLTKWSKSLIYAINRSENWLDYRDSIRRANVEPKVEPKFEPKVEPKDEIPTMLASQTSRLTQQDVDSSVLSELIQIRQLLAELLTTKEDEERTIKRFWN